MDAVDLRGHSIDLTVPVGSPIALEFTAPTAILDAATLSARVVDLRTGTTVTDWATTSTPDGADTTVRIELTGAATTGVGPSVSRWLFEVNDVVWAAGDFVVSREADTRPGSVASQSFTVNPTGVQPVAVTVVGPAGPPGADGAGSTDAVDDFDSVVFVSTVGDDANDGLNPTAPKATFASAITQASALLVAGAPRVKVDVLDAGSYTEAGDLTVPSYVSLHAPAATYTGRVFLETFASFDIHTHYASENGQRMLNRTFGGSDAGTAFYKCKVSDGRGAAGTITGASNVFNQGGAGRNLFVDLELMWVGTNGVGITDQTGGDAGHIHFILADLYLAGGGAVGIRASAAESNIIGYVDHILETGSFISTSAIRVVAAGAEVRVTASGIVADTAYYITDGNLYLSCPRIVGTRTGTPAQLMLGTSDVAPVATSGAYSDLSGTPTLGTAAAADTSAFDPAGSAATAQAAAIAASQPLDDDLTTLSEGGLPSNLRTTLDARYVVDEPPPPAAGGLGGVAWYDLRGDSPDTYYSLDTGGTDGTLIPGSSGLSRQSTGTPVTLAVQSRMRRCLLDLDGSHVNAYLDCDDSSKLAGDWLRIHEGITDPVSPTPGQAATGNAWLRDGVNSWVSGATHQPGDRVLDDGKLWEALVTTNAQPAAGAVAATVDGTAGMVMVEIPRFYVREVHDAATGRHAWDVAIIPEHAAPFPDLSADLDATLPTEVTVDGAAYTVHKAFMRAGKQRSHRYIAAYRATATDPGNNGAGTLRSLPGDTSSRSISLTNFRAKARNMNSGLGASDPSGAADNVWSLVDFWTWDAVILLQFLEYRSHDTDNTIGAGRISGSDFGLVAGVPLSGNGSGVFDAAGVALTPTASSSPFVVFRGVEHPWGGNWLWVDGCNIEHTATPDSQWWTSDTPAGFTDNTSTGHELLGVSFNGANNNWSYGRQFDVHPLLMSVAGGSASSYFHAGVYFPSATGWRSLLAGCAAVDGAAAGSRCAYVSVSSTNSGGAVGAALAR